MDPVAKEEYREKLYWQSVSNWVQATRQRYAGYHRSELTQCFMRGPFAGWSERQLAELADHLAASATRYPLRGHEDLKWGEEVEPIPASPSK